MATRFIYLDTIESIPNFTTNAYHREEFYLARHEVRQFDAQRRDMNFDELCDQLFNGYDEFCSADAQCSYAPKGRHTSVPVGQAPA